MGKYFLNLIEFFNENRHEERYGSRDIPWKKWITYKGTKKPRVKRRTAVKKNKIDSVTKSASQGNQNNIEV